MTTIETDYLVVGRARRTNQDAALANADALLDAQEGALHAVR